LVRVERDAIGSKHKSRRASLLASQGLSLQAACRTVRAREKPGAAAESATLAAGDRKYRALALPDGERKPSAVLGDDRVPAQSVGQLAPDGVGGGLEA
jgi:hypothetical protein